MITLFRLLGSSRGLLAASCLAVLATCPAFGQSSNASARAQALAVHRQANNDAKAQAARGDIEAVVQNLDRLSSAPAGSAARHLHTAQRLTEMANTLMRSAQPHAAQAAATRALALLAAAERLPANSNLRSAIQSQKGILHERFLGDDASALEAFRQAAELEPGNVAAKEKLTRVKDTEANVRGKVRAGSR